MENLLEGATFQVAQPGGKARTSLLSEVSAGTAIFEGTIPRCLVQADSGLGKEPSKEEHSKKGHFACSLSLAATERSHV